MEADVMMLLYHAEVRWLSRGMVLKCVFRLRQELCVFLAQHKHPIGINFQDNFWLAKMVLFVFNIKRTNRLNLSLQGKGPNVFEVDSKIKAFQQKLSYGRGKYQFATFQMLNR